MRRPRPPPGPPGGHRGQTRSPGPDGSGGALCGHGHSGNFHRNKLKCRACLRRRMTANPLPSPPHLSADGGDRLPHKTTRGGRRDPATHDKKRRRAVPAAPQVARPKPTRRPPTWGARLPGSGEVPGGYGPSGEDGEGQDPSPEGKRPGGCGRGLEGTRRTDRYTRRISRPADSWSEPNKADWLAFLMPGLAFPPQPP